MSAAKTRIMLVDDHSLVRAGLSVILGAEEDFEVVGQAGDGDEALRLSRQIEPDVIVMDVFMPVKDGVDACREIIDELPNTRVLMMTASTEEQAVVEAVAAGATGYLQKFSTKENFIQTIRDVAAGEIRISADVRRQAFEEIRRTAYRANPQEMAKLTVREREILALFARGMSYKDIAGARGIQPVTARNAIYGIQAKLGAGSKQEMVVWAVNNGLLDVVFNGDDTAEGC